MAYHAVKYGDKYLVVYINDKNLTCEFNDVMCETSEINDAELITYALAHCGEIPVWLRERWERWEESKIKN